MLSLDRTISAGNCTDGAFRLVRGNNALEGRVEICINNAWGTVCDNAFSSEDTKVALSDLKCSHVIGSEASISSRVTCVIMHW